MFQNYTFLEYESKITRNSNHKVCKINCNKILKKSFLYRISNLLNILPDEPFKLINDMNFFQLRRLAHQHFIGDQIEKRAIEICGLLDDIENNI